jgi:Ricin-type beta-trefoil lectin domain
VRSQAPGLVPPMLPGQPHRKAAAGGKARRKTSTPGSGRPQQMFRAAAAIPTRRIVSNASGRCVEVLSGGGAGTIVQIWDCTSASWQQWSFRADGTIRWNNLCVTVAGEFANGTPIRVEGCNGGAAQRFALNSSQDLVNVSADRCVDVKDQKTENGTPLQLWQCGGTSNQKFHTA